MPRTTKAPSPPSPTEYKPTLGLSPELLARRRPDKAKNDWCSLADPTSKLYDPACDEYNPQPVYYKDVCKANKYISKHITPTSLIKSKCCAELGLELYYKIETSHLTGSYHERQAMYVLHMLSDEQRKDGVYTASIGNWGFSLAHYGRKFGVPVTIVMCTTTAMDAREKCRSYGATVVVHGNDLNEARKKALIMISQSGVGTYIDGSDHPNVIASAGTIAMEILQDLPTVNAILVPVGGGGLIAGVATVIKRLRPDIKIYGIEPNEHCCFFKALVNERPYQVTGDMTIACTLAVPIAGYNAFYTARSLIDKMVLVQDSAVVRAMLHMLEDEKIVSQGSGAMGLAAIMSTPNLVPELRGKKVVTIVSEGNISPLTLQRVMIRAKMAEGRLLVVTVNFKKDETQDLVKICKIFSDLDCNLVDEAKNMHGMVEASDIEGFSIEFLVEVRDWKQACTVRRVISKLYPDRFTIRSDPFEREAICNCIKTQTWI